MIQILIYDNLFNVNSDLCLHVEMCSVSSSWRIVIMRLYFIFKELFVKREFINNELIP